MESRIPIAEQYELKFHERPSAWRKWRRRTNWCAVAMATVMCVAWLAWGDHRAFQSHPVRPAHAHFAQDCQQCHDRRWQTAMRLIPFSGKRRSVSDAACLDCHQSEIRAGDHHFHRLDANFQQERLRVACAECHREHRADDSDLTTVRSRFCIDCHTDLDAIVDGSLQFTDGIHGFDESHPVFPYEVGRDVDARHSFANVSGQVVGTPGRQDHGGILFNHAQHLEPSTVKAELTCSSCHVPDFDGRTMRPVNYESHCSDCHSLSWQDHDGAEIKLPHGEPAMVSAAIWAAIVESLATPDRDSDVEGQTPLIQPLEGGFERAVESKSLAKAELAVFGPSAKGHCRKCHHVVRQGGHQWKILNFNPQVFAGQVKTTDAAKQPMIPRRWLLHANFDHSRHQTLRCETCHANGGEAVKSEHSTDILLPARHVCFECHHSEQSLSHGSSVLSECQTCHSYHDDLWQQTHLRRDTGGPPADRGTLTDYLRSTKPSAGESSP